MFWLSSYKSWMKASSYQLYPFGWTKTVLEQGLGRARTPFPEMSRLVVNLFHDIIQTSVCHEGEIQNEYDSKCNSFLHRQ